MNEICGDNRFEIIAKAKAHLLDATNIDTSEDEMKVLDSFLFRCWQMGWLDRYDRKTENCSEKPNNCEPQTYVINPQEPTNDDKCFECDDFFTCGGQCNKIKDEPTGYNLTPVEDEPQTERSE